MPAFIDSKGHQHSARNYCTAVPNLLIARIQEHIRHLPKRPVAPSLQLLIEQPGGPAHLRAGHLQPAQLAHHRRDLPGRYAFNVHLGDGALQCPLAPHAALQSRRIELYLASYLGHLQSEFAYPCAKRLRL